MRHLQRRLLAAITAASAVSVVASEGCGGTVTGALDASAPTDGASVDGPGAGAAAGADAARPDAADVGVFDASGYVCEAGAKSVGCYTHDELVFLLEHPPRGGDPRPDAGGRFDADGCLPANEVKNDCCNPASAGPTLESGKCCYVFCTTACCGRLLVVKGAPRIAEVVVRGGWTPREPRDRHAVGRDAELTLQQRRTLADAWARDAAFEHASIASFARFSLDLLAFGAPSDLVRQTHEAALDEVRHAASAFALAARFRGAPLGPGPLPCEGVAVSSSLAVAVARTVHEGCTAEVVAAAVARRALEGARDEEVRATLSGICEDETRHAELAYRFVVWALRAGGEDVHAAARAAFEAALGPASFDEGPAAREGDEDETLLGWYGQLSRRRRADVEHDARASLLVPLRDAVMSCVSCDAGRRFAARA